VPTAPRGTSDNRAASTAFVTGSGGAGPRIVLPSATTFYVATNGSDSNDGLTSATAWLTLAHAMSVITGQYDFGGQTVTLQAVAGHAAFTLPLNLLAWEGGGGFIFDGGGGSIGSAAGNAVGCAVALPGGGVTLQNASLADSVGSAINHNGVGTINLGSGLTFPASARNHMLCQNTGARILINSGYTISGGTALAHGRTFFSGAAIEAINTITIITVGSPNFGLAFMDAEDASLIYFGSGQVKFKDSGGGPSTATGQHYLANKGAVIDTNGGGPNYFPGNAAGAVSGGGQYF
jgi:hypothetical protein